MKKTVWKRKGIWIVVVLLFFAGGIFWRIRAQKFTHSTVTIKTEESRSKMDEDQRAILRAISLLAKNSQFSGQVLIRRNGKIAATFHTGYKNKEKNQKVKETTLFPIASQSKVFCGVIIAQLIREGKLAYEDNLSLYLPEVPGAEEVTIRECLSHTSRYSSPEVAPEKFLQTQEKILEFTNSITTQIAEKEFHYSNSNFVYLALAASRIEGEDYAKLVEKRILKKLGMKHTHFPTQLDESDLPVSYAVVEKESYQADSTNYSLNLLSGLLGAGELCSTAQDMDLFFNGLENGKLLTDNERKQLFHPKENSVYSAGFSLKPGNEGYYSTLGSFDGQGIESYYEGEAENKHATIVLSNMHNVSISELGDEFFQKTSKWGNF